MSSFRCIDASQLFIFIEHFEDVYHMPIQISRETWEGSYTCIVEHSIKQLLEICLAIWMTTCSMPETGYVFKKAHRIYTHPFMLTHVCLTCRQTYEMDICQCWTFTEWVFPRGCENFFAALAFGYQERHRKSIVFSRFLCFTYPALTSACHRANRKQFFCKGIC